MRREPETRRCSSRSIRSGGDNVKTSDLPSRFGHVCYIRIFVNNFFLYTTSDVRRLFFSRHETRKLLSTPSSTFHQAAAVAKTETFISLSNRLFVMIFFFYFCFKATSIRFLRVFNDGARRFLWFTLRFVIVQYNGDYRFNSLNVRNAAAPVYFSRRKLKNHFIIQE